MSSLLPELTPIRVLPKTLDAHCYNRARLALLRLGTPLRVALPGLRGLQVILERDCWLCVDSHVGDRPILAWTDFLSREPDTLHSPVSCALHLYDHRAGLVMGFALEALEQRLERDLGAASRT
ncbi:MAG TPA: hypothetical protein VKA76_02485 [Gammaproteobacteria bacterium]|nr:hypothetical protein [Gammaproteobacteria bacterium]